MILLADDEGPDHDTLANFGFYCLHTPEDTFSNGAALERVTKFFLRKYWYCVCMVVYIHVQSTLIISNSKGLTETLRDIRTSTYQSWESEENNKLNKHI